MAKQEILIQSIAHSYWRRIKDGARTFESLSTEPKGKYPSMRDQVLYLAKTDVENDVMSKEEFEHYTGLAYEK